MIDQDAPQARDDGLEVLSAGALGLPDSELASMRGIYGIAELTTALKPHLLRHLLDADADVVVFLDSDTDIHADLNDVASLAARHGVVLSTHMLEPPPLDGWSPGELEKATSGVFNSGFLAVSREARPFLDWWASRLRRDCLFCDPIGMHADQRWLDFAPSYFDVHVLRDPGVNVAQWNIHERRIRWDGGAYRVNDGPLRAFHFAGFDPTSPDRPSKYGWITPLRTDFSAEVDLVRLCREYAGRLFEAGYEEFRRVPYGHASTAAGTPLGIWERRVYRELLIAAEARGRDIPDPFSADRRAEFERLLADPGRAGLLSDAARARIADMRIGDLRTTGDRLDPLRIVAGLSRQAVRRLPGRRNAWTPHPLPSDRTRLEYGSPAPSHDSTRGDHQ